MFSNPNSNSKGVKRQSSVSKEKQVEEVVCKRRGTEEDEEAEYEKEEKPMVSAVTRQLCIKPIENGENMDKEVILRRIRQRKRVNKVRAVVGTFLSSSSFTTNTDKSNNASPVQQKKWVDDAFAAL